MRNAEQTIKGRAENRANKTVEGQTEARHDGPTRSRAGDTPRRSRGMALATVLMLSVVLAVLAFATFALVSNLLKSTTRRANQVEALNTADAGLDLAIAWLQSQPSPPTNSQLQPLTNFYGTNGTISKPFGLDGSSLKVAIYADAQNPGPTQKKYVVESTATLPGGIRKIVRAYVQQVSFGKYAFFADKDSAGFYTYDNHFEGPYHCNRADGLDPTFVYKVPPPVEGPIFTYAGDDAFTVSGPATFHKNTYGNVSAPTTAADFSAIAAGGQTSMTYGWQTDVNGNVLYDANSKPIPKAPPIELPQTNYEQAYVSLGLTPPANPTALPTNRPTTYGVTVTAGGGLYIRGQSAITCSVDATGNQVFTVVSKSGTNTKTQTVTVNPVAPNTILKTVVKDVYGATVTNTSATTAGVPNGMIFADDHITGLSGTIANNRVDNGGNVTYRNAWTIATDTGAGKDIIYSDSIVYQTGRAKDTSGNYTAQATDTAFNTNAGTLGLLARDVKLRTGGPAKVEVDAMIFCTGSYKAEDATSIAGALGGKMTNIGGVIVKESGLWAYVYNSGALYSGWIENYHYDTRMADNPPPYFPTTGNKYKVVSWQIVPSPIK